MDQIDLVEKQGEGFAYHQCPQCEGLWMRHRALRMLVQHHNKKVDFIMPRPEDAYNSLHHGAEFDTNDITQCPLDGSNYYEYAFGNVILDICPTCDGVWLDQGELDKLAHELENFTVTGVLVDTVFNNIGAFFAQYFSKGK